MCGSQCVTVNVIHMLGLKGTHILSEPVLQGCLKRTQTKYPIGPHGFSVILPPKPISTLLGSSMPLVETKPPLGTSTGGTPGQLDWVDCNLPQSGEPFCLPVPRSRRSQLSQYVTCRVRCPERFRPKVSEWSVTSLPDHLHQLN